MRITFRQICSVVYPQINRRARFIVVSPLIQSRARATSQPNKQTAHTKTKPQPNETEKNERKKNNQTTTTTTEHRKKTNKHSTRKRQKHSPFIKWFNVRDSFIYFCHGKNVEWNNLMYSIKLAGASNHTQLFLLPIYVLAWKTSHLEWIIITAAVENVFFLLLLLVQFWFWPSTGSFAPSVFGMGRLFCADTG